MTIVELSMFPVGKEESLSSYVARVLEIIDQSGLPYLLNPMGTVIEGDWDKVMAVISKCHQALEQDCARIATTIKIDYRKGAAPRMATKIDAVEAKAGKRLQK